MAAEIEIKELIEEVLTCIIEYSKDFVISKAELFETSKIIDEQMLDSKKLIKTPKIEQLIKSLGEKTLENNESHITVKEKEIARELRSELRKQWKNFILE
ncbi:hypothetical protein [Crocosphaera sp. Alani8]|uniref:hypothetical protein n=1 Tax=Crocosphaera sp. Alani8 TaxID=3038952 RepID=UPI00313EC371